MSSRCAHDIQAGVEIGRVAGAGRDDDAIRLQGGDIGERRSVRHDRDPRAAITSERTMLRLTPQSSTTTCGPSLGHLGLTRSFETSSTTGCSPGSGACLARSTRSSSLRFAGVAHEHGAHIADVRIWRVSARVSIPEMPGIPCCFK